MNHTVLDPEPLTLDHVLVKRRALRQIMRSGLAESGLSPEAAKLLMENLRNLGIDALLPAISVSVTVDVGALKRQKAYKDAEQDNIKLLRRFIQARAGTALLRALFPSVSLREIESLRQKLGMPAPQIAEDLSLEDHRYLRHIWAKICTQIHNPWGRYLALHDHLPRHSLYTLFCALNQSFCVGEQGDTRGAP